MDKASGEAAKGSGGAGEFKEAPTKVESQFDKEVAKDFGEGGMFDDGTSELVNNIENENAMANAEDGLNKAVANSDPSKIMNQTKAQKFQSKMGKAAGIANIAMEGVGLIMNQKAYRDGINKDKEDVMNQTIQGGQFSYA